MNNLFMIIAFLVLWVVVIAQGYVLYTFSKEIEEFTRKIISINSSKGQE